MNLPRPQPATHAEVMAWRRGERERLGAERLALSVPTRQAHAQAIATHLDAWLKAQLGSLRGQVVAVYWPLRGEPNLRHWMEQLHAEGAVCALPVAATPPAPLVFRRWQPGAPMTAGVWHIPQPVDSDAVRPRVVVAPVLGFAPGGWRLGWGGGYYDRTLAALAASGPAPLTVGVGHAQGALRTIYPLAHDVPLDCIVTELGVA